MSKAIKYFEEFERIFLPIYFKTKKQALEYLLKYKIEVGESYIITRTSDNRYKIEKR